MNRQQSSEDRSRANVVRGWRSLRIKDLCDSKGTFVQTGPFGSQLHESDYSLEGVPVIMPKDISNGSIRTEHIARVSENHAVRLKRHRVQSGDIVYARRGDIGRHALIRKTEDGWLCGTGGLLIRIDSKVCDSLYLHYYLSQQSVVDFVTNQAIGATMPNLNTAILMNTPVYLPSILVQRKIAAVLSAHDDLIENNNRRIAILEEMAEEIYREWFVRMRFPGHEKAKLHKGTPARWQYLPCSSVLRVMSGGTPKTEVPGYWDGGIPFFTPKDADTGFYVIDTEKHVTEAGLNSCNSKLYARNTIFITARGTVGKIALCASEMAMNQSCYALAPIQDKEEYFCFLALRDSIKYIKGISKSGVFDNIIVDTFNAIPVLRPGDELVTRFNALMKPLFDSLGGLLMANRSLRTSRDLLLSRLITGKLSVEDLDIKFPPSMKEADG